MSVASKKILLAEDDPGIIEVVKIILEEEGHRVFVASSKAEVLSIVNEQTPHIIFLDILLAGDNGKVIAEILRNHERASRVPVIFLSANSELPAIAKEAGVAGYLQKPFEITDLLDKVKSFS